MTRHRVKAGREAGTDSGGLILWVCLTYCFMLLPFLLASIYPGGRVWGVNWWAYYGSWFPMLMLGIGVILGFGVFWWNISGSSHSRTEPEKARANERGYYVWAGMVLLLYGFLFVILRTKTHFLGDGYQLLRLLSDQAPTFTKFSETGEALVHLLAWNMVGGGDQASALLSYRIISITAGLLFVLVGSWFARTLLERTVERLLFLLGLCSGGYMLLFFGYAENYSLFVLSVLAYSVTGMTIAQGKASRYWILLPLGMAVFFHVMGFTLLPSAVYLLIGPSRLGQHARGWRPLTWVAVLLPAVGVALAVFHQVYVTSYFFRFAIVPLFENQFTVDGYTLFSLNHLADYVNLVVMLLPGMLVLVVGMFSLPIRRTISQRPNVFLAVLTVSVLGAAFIFDPKLGMPRDWDLFSFAGVPLAAFMYYLVLGSSKSRNPTLVAGMSIMLGLLSLIPRVFALNDPEIIVTHLVNYRNMDAAKCRNAQALLKEYYAETGAEWVEEIRQKEWIGTYEQITLYNRGIDYMNRGEFAKAASSLERTCAIDPLFWNARVALSACYIQLRMYDAALSALEIAEGVNPGNPNIYSNMAFAYSGKGLYREAEKMFLRCIELDTSSIAPYIGLISLYKTTGQEALYREYLLGSAKRSDAPVALLTQLGDYMISRGQYRAAGQAFRQAIEKGLDVESVRQRIAEYPKLEPHLLPEGE